MRNSRGMASRVPGSSLPTDAFEDSLEALVEHVSLATSGGSRSSSSNSGGYLDSFSPADTGFQGLPMPAPPLPAAPPPRAAAMTSAPSADIQPGEYGVLVGSPSGQHLQIDIMSTWGDPHYVGLSALELFDEYGDPIELDSPELQVRADPADINVLPEYGHDVRVVANLFDGTLRTCDDAHLWLAPFTPGRRNYIYIDLGAPRTLSMLRVWNYNKSRIHSFRGARLLEIRMDAQVTLPWSAADDAALSLIAIDDAALSLIATDDAALSLIATDDAALSLMATDYATRR